MGFQAIWYFTDWVACALVGFKFEMLFLYDSEDGNAEHDTLHNGHITSILKKNWTMSAKDGIKIVWVKVSLN